MSEQSPESLAATNDMARNIYVSLVSGAVQFKEQGGVAMAVSPDNLVQLSYKLAEAFVKVEDQRAQASKPKATTLDVGKIDFGV